MFESGLLLPLEEHVLKPSAALRRKCDMIEDRIEDPAPGAGGRSIVQHFRVGTDHITAIDDPKLPQVVFRVVDWRPSRFKVARSRWGHHQQAFVGCSGGDIA